MTTKLKVFKMRGKAERSTASPGTAIPTFADVCSELRKDQASVLIGNGFNQGYLRKFSNANLWKHADRSVQDHVRVTLGLPTDSKITAGHEDVYLQLSEASRIVTAHSLDGATSERLAEIAGEMLDALFTAVRVEIPPKKNIPKELDVVHKALNQFGSVFTLNYDIIPVLAGAQEREFFFDGFTLPRDPEDGTRIWFGRRASNKTGNSSIYYLHGSLHVFVKGNEVFKVTSAAGGGSRRLVDVIADYLTKGYQNTCVAGGTCE